MSRKQLRTNTKGGEPEHADKREPRSPPRVYPDHSSSVEKRKKAEAVGVRAQELAEQQLPKQTALKKQVENSSPNNQRSIGQQQALLEQLMVHLNTEMQRQRRDWPQDWELPAGVGSYDVGMANMIRHRTRGVRPRSGAPIS